MEGIFCFNYYAEVRGAFTEDVNSLLWWLSFFLCVTL